jgi:hypothetical protein
MTRLQMKITSLSTAIAIFALGGTLMAHATDGAGQSSQSELAQPGKTPQVSVPLIAPRPEDVSSIDGMMKAFYEVISGPAGQPRQWSRDRTLYISGVWFVAMKEDAKHNPQALVMSHQQMVDRFDSALVDKGFFESEIHRRTERFGNIAHILSTYESRNAKNGPVIDRGVNSIELFWDGQRWWIAGAIWDEERSDNPIPKELLP